MDATQDAGRAVSSPVKRQRQRLANCCFWLDLPTYLATIDGYETPSFRQRLPIVTLVTVYRNISTYILGRSSYTKIQVFFIRVVLP